MYKRQFLNPAKAQELLAHYLQACEENDKEPRPVIRKDVIILEDGEDPSALSSLDLDTPPVLENHKTMVSDSVQALNLSESTGPLDKRDINRIFASPLARRIAEKNSIDLNSIMGSGPRGRVIKRDVEAFLVNRANEVIETTSPSPVPDPKTLRDLTHEIPQQHLM